MIVVEGADCVGKTTLCKMLLEHLPTHIYAHFTRLPAEFDYYWGYVDRMSPCIVQDRFYLSEIIYAAIRSEKPGFDYETLRLIEASFRQVGGLTVVVTAEPKIIRKRWTNDQMYPLEKVLTANMMFGNHDCLWKAYVDQWVTCDEGGFHESQVAAILAAYTARQATIKRLARRTFMEQAYRLLSPGY